MARVPVYSEGLLCRDLQTDEEIRLDDETGILDNENEVDYDSEIKTVREAAEISEEELEAERAAIKSEAEAPEVFSVGRRLRQAVQAFVEILRYL